MNKRICRDTRNKMISGVCSGFARYFNLDVSIVRILWVVLTLFSAGFPGVILYAACALIIPESNVWDDEAYKNQKNYNNSTNGTTYYAPPRNDDNK